MSTPEILYRNLLKVAQLGRGDGTIYAYGSGATPVVADKTFDLTAGYTEMADLTPGDDLHNGAILTFTVSDRSYLITDWVTATELATVFEPPNAEDTGAWTIRRTLYTDDFNVANPIRYGSNGQLEKKWIDKAANNAASIFAAAPNGIDDGGAELNSLADYWTAATSGGSTGAVTVNSSSPLLGTYDYLFTIGDRTTISITQPGKIDLRKGYTYGIILKTIHGGAPGTDIGLYVSLGYTSAGDVIYAPVTFTKINSEDALAGTNDVRWRPSMVETASWDEITFTIPENIDAGDWVFELLADATAEVTINVDEIYIWEIGPTVSGLDQADTLIIAGHNMAGGFAAGSDVRGLRCQADLTSYDSTDPSDDMDILIDLDSDVTVAGDSVIYETFTAATAIFPIHEITLAAVSGKTWECSELWVGKRWTWGLFLSGDWEPVEQDVHVVSSVTIGGNKRVSERYEQKLRVGTIASLADNETARWESFIKEVGRAKPFWYYIQAIAELGLAAEIMLMRNRSTPKLPMNADRFRSANYDFEEVL